MPAAKFSRRDVLSAAAGLAAAGSMLPAACAEHGNLNLGIQLYSLRGYPVDEALKHARDLGFRFVEFYPGMYPLNSTPEQIAAMNKKLADLGLTISAHGVNGFGGDAAANRKVFEFAKAAGIRTLSADPALEQAGFPADGALSLEYEENPKDPLADIRECLDVARSALAAA